MSAEVLTKLLAIVAMVAIGWGAGRAGWLAKGAGGTDAARVLGNAALYVFVPALLFRTTARLDLASLPGTLLVAYFVPALALVAAVMAQQHLQRAARRHGPVAPAQRAITAVFGNSVQMGIPVAAALFGEAGLALHIALVSVHALVLLTVLTASAELALARDRGGGGRLLPMLGRTLKQTLLHPVVGPIVAGLLWNQTGLALPPLADEVLRTLATAVVPLCLVLIGASLAAYGTQGRMRSALALSAVKLLVLPAAVLAFAHGALGLSGLPLAVLVMMAALPVGSNALIFAQQYEGAAPGPVLKAEASAAIVASTVAYAATATGWLALLAGLGHLGTIAP